MRTMLYPKIAIALVTAALFTAGATAATAASSHDHRHPPTVHRTQTPPPADLGSLIRTAIAKELKSGKVSTTDADLVRLFLDGAIKPDLQLRDAWEPIVRAAASYIGVTTAALQSDLATGDSLASIAHRHDRSPEGLTQAVLAASRVPLDKAVADGSLTEAGKADILDLMRRNLGEFLRARL